MQIKKPVIPILWGVIVLLLIVLLNLQFRAGIAIETNILDLLPPSEKDPVVDQALRVFNNHVARKMLFLIGHPDEKKAVTIAGLFTKEARQSGVFLSVSFRQDSYEKAFRELYFPHRFQMLSPDVKELLRKENNIEHFFAEITELLYSPLSSFFTSSLREDPLLLFPRFVRALPKHSGKVRVQNGVMIIDQEEMHYALVAATTHSSAFSVREQKKVLGFVEEEITNLRRSFPRMQAIFSGLIRFAAAGAETMHKEIAVIGLGSLLGILILILATFRSLPQLVVSVLPLAVGMLFALSLSLVVFSELHMLTLVFGASLIGVCIDYTFHYLAEQRVAKGEWDPYLNLQRVLPGITLGALTSIIGYLGLSITPFPGLQQMAIFSSLGLLGAYGTVVCWFPLLLRKRKQMKEPLLYHCAKAQLNFWNAVRTKKWWWLSLFVILLVSLIGVARLQPNDDIRLLQHVSPRLIEQEKVVQGLISDFSKGTFLLVEGETKQELLEHLEGLTAKLSELRAAEVIGSFLSLSALLPSIKQQKENKALLQKAFLVDPEAVKKEMDRIGFKEEVTIWLLDQLAGSSEQYLTVAQWLDSPVSASLEHLWLGRTSRGYASIVLLSQIEKETVLEQGVSDLSGVHFVNKVRSITDLFRRYREIAAKLVLGAYVVIYLLLLWRYGPLKGTAVVLPPAFSAIVTLGILGLGGETISLFHVLALLLVLGIGIDYSIFFGEGRTERAATMLAIMLSACTTVLSFGLLSLSETPVLHTLGWTLLLGIVFALIFSPLPTLICGEGGEKPEKA